MPKISVLMSVYNAASFLREAIDSVLNQSFTDFEFIIFDDCSTDGSLEILKSYEDCRIRLICNTTNRGLTWNLHDGMNMAQGEYLARMDADDICMPDRFAKQVEFLDKNPDISVLGSAVLFFDEAGMKVDGKQPLTHDEIRVELLLSFTMLHPSVMLRLTDFKKLSLNYDPHFRYSQDFDLWTRASRELKFANLPEILLHMREHSFKISRALKPQQKAFSDEIRENQFQEFKIEFSKHQKIAFHLATSRAAYHEINTPELEQLLIKLLSANRNVGIYRQSLLEYGISRLFFEVCREQLVAGNKNGLRFWTSSLRRYGNYTAKNYLGMVYRSASLLLR